MSVTTDFSTESNALTIKVNGRFDFSKHSEFRHAYEKAEPQPAKFILDMTSVEYMDSSALGMLLILREHAGGDSAQVSIENCGTEIRDILATANFERLFRIG